jgi:hypothetical protein
MSRGLKQDLTRIAEKKKGTRQEGDVGKES